MRTTLHILACLTGSYAAVCWVTGLLTDAGVAGAMSAAAIITAEAIRYCGVRGRDRMREGRALVWARRDEEVIR